jgi:MFS family permease
LPVPASLRIFAQVARNAALARLVVAYALFTVSEYAVWVAMLVFAYEQGGATQAGLIALAQLAPAAVVAPLAAALADRRSPLLVLAGGYVVQAVGGAVTAAAILGGAAPVFAYAGAVLAAAAVSTTRPAQAVLVPALTLDVSELTAANVLIGWVESVSIMVAGALVGITLALWGVGYVFAVAAVVLAIAVLLVSPLRTRPTHPHADETTTLGHLTEGFREVFRSRTARLLVGMLAAEDVVIGALDVLFVVLALDVLQAGQAWAGYLNTAYGAGGVVLGSLAALLVGRRLGPVITASAMVLGIGLAATAVTSQRTIVVVLVVLVGGCRALFEVATRTLLQRAVPAEMVGRVFGLSEGLTMTGLGIGSLLAPALVAVGGDRVALAGVAALLPLAILVRGRVLMQIDQHAQVPVVEISLLRSIPLFRMLPGPALEGLARALERVEYAPGSVLMREGDEGDRYHAIADGTVEIHQAGNRIALLHRGSGLGEIALLSGGVRTATASAASAVTTYALDRESFLTAVNGHVPTLQSASDVVDELRERDRRRGAADAS